MTEGRRTMKKATMSVKMAAVTLMMWSIAANSHFVKSSYEILGFIENTQSLLLHNIGNSCGHANHFHHLFSQQPFELFDVGDASTSSSSISPPTFRSPVMNMVYNIREAKYSDLNQVADLTTDAFFFANSDANTMKNSISVMRTIRYLLELDRLQNNFPYKSNIGDYDDDKHFYLVATPLEDETRIIGFCDIDGRKPTTSSGNFGSIDGLGLLAKMIKPKIQRPCPYFSDLVVHRSYRRLGIASSLITDAECRARYWLYDELYLCRPLDDELLLRMYGERGYASVDTSIMSKSMMDFLAAQKGVELMRRNLE